MAELATPTVRLRRFGAELRAIREERGLSIQAVARCVDRSDSALSKLENGRTFMLPRDVNQVLAGYGITDPATRAMLHTLMRDGRKKGWWQSYGDALPPEALDYMRIEFDSAVIRSFQPIAMPGLFQTRETAEAAISSGGWTDAQTTRLVAIRMKRQALFKREQPPRLHFVVGEAAIRQQVGGREVMRGQLARLAEASTLDHVELQVLPFTAGACMGSRSHYVILELAEPPDIRVVFLETLAGSIWVERHDLVERHTLAFSQVSELALPVEESRALIEHMAAQI